MNFIKEEFREIKRTLQVVPSMLTVLFVASIILMNLLANKSINFNVSFLALDCGIVVSWLSFLTMDVVIKAFGPRTSIQLSIVSTLVNLLMCGILWIASIIPGTWGESFVANGEIINIALDHTIGGTWYVVLGSTIAFLVASIVNALTNHVVGKVFVKDNFISFAMRSYVSTMFGQFVDNFTFSLIVSHNFFGWTMLQCVMCSLTGAVVELLFEIIFSPFGFKISKQLTHNRGE